MPSNRVIDNLIAFRVLSMLVKPFKETDAYKLGIIDEKGNTLIKSSQFTTDQQRNAFNYLTRLIFNLKKLINKLPGGESKLKNIIAAFFLLKEAYKTNSTRVDEEQLNEIVKLLDDGVILAEEQLVVEEFLSLNEEAPVNATGPMVSTDQPAIRKPKRFGKFIVNDEIYNKFSDGKVKYRKWANYLNLQNEGEKMIYDFARKNPKSVIILQNGKERKIVNSYNLKD